MIIDSHCHIFTERIRENVGSRREMLAELKLNTHDAGPRLPPQALQVSAERNDIDLCFLLPTAPPDKVRAENDRFIGHCEGLSRVRTLATLHPDMSSPSDEIRRMLDAGIARFKLSSFTQRFDLTSPATERMLSELENLCHAVSLTPAVVFDTFVKADVYFGADPVYLTTPAKLGTLASRHPGINFIGAHMGGLLANIDDVRSGLSPAPNVYLDTANAAHTFTEQEFIELLRIHGPQHVLFGTDWPWFVHNSEIPKIEDLLKKAGFNEADRADVFSGNAMRLYGIEK